MKRTVHDTAAFLSSKAEEMRCWPTKSERVLARFLEPMGFKAQVVLDGRILDFCHEVAKLIIEVDGGVHRRQKGRDRRRDRDFTYLGYATLRVRNADVLKYPEMIAETIRQKVQERTGK